MKHLAFLASILLSSNNAVACPFCDTGGEETAIYVVLVFGLFMAAMGLVLLAATKSGLFKDTENSTRNLLAAEAEATRDLKGTMR